MANEQRRSTDGTLLGLVQGWPARWQVIAVLLGWFGPMAVITLFFMAVLAGWLKSPITYNTAYLIYIRDKLDNAIVRMHERVMESRYKDEQQIRLLLATCRNVARDSEGRRECDTYWIQPRGK